jgi:hypothetical protein
MSKPSVIKIADHAERLSRLRLDEREGRPPAPGEIERGYDRVCLGIFGHTTADDFDQNDFPDDLADWYQVVVEDGAEAFANQHGYSLKRHTGTMLDDWDAFLVLIVAKVRGLFRSP